MRFKSSGPGYEIQFRFLLDETAGLRQIYFARAHGMWTYEPRQGRKAATVVCSVSAVVTLTFLFMIYDLRFTIGKRQRSQIVNQKS